MENFDQIFTLLAHEEGISLNFDILETGIVNITALVAILVYVGRDFLGSILEQRQKEIAQSVQDAEERLNQANKRLADAEKQLTQAYIIIDEIRNETISAKKLLLLSDASDSKKDLTTKFSRALATSQTKERQVFLEVKQQIIALVLKQTIGRAQQTFGSKQRATALINETINKLEGDLL
jgi:F-type H+-transporting ATPase subunit b